MTLLRVDDLRVTFTRRGAPDVTAVDGVSFTLEAGKITGLVGESGCGKSVTSLALMGLLPRRGVRVGGTASFEAAEGALPGPAPGPGGGVSAPGAVDLLALDSQHIRDLRGSQIAMVFQDPLSSLNPVVPIGVQVAEILVRHRGMKREAARKEAVDLLDRVGIPDPARRIKEYPHQQSGGIRQRALIAIAVACRPRMMIADEPTTALDVTIQAQILELLKELVTEEGTSLLMITHDLGVVAGMCDHINVLYAGKVVESATRLELFAAPTHPYSAGLLGSIPRLDAPRGEPLTPIRGSINDNIAWSDGCAFAPRCDRYSEACLGGDLELTGDSERHLYRCAHPLGQDKGNTEEGVRR